VARLAGIAPATVSDVRRRLLSGEPPIPAQAPPPDASKSGRTAADPVEEVLPESAKRAEPRAAMRGGRLAPPDPALLDKLLNDPSLRHREEERRLFRVLQRNAIGERGWFKLTAAVPAHCGDLARRYMQTRMEVAQELDEDTE
jgi:hypothetical protein